jgi:hypothetical protein
VVVVVVVVTTSLADLNTCMTPLLG